MSNIKNGDNCYIACVTRLQVLAYADHSVATTLRVAAII